MLNNNLYLESYRFFLEFFLITSSLTLIIVYSVLKTRKTILGLELSKSYCRLLTVIYVMGAFLVANEFGHVFQVTVPKLINYPYDLLLKPKSDFPYASVSYDRIGAFTRFLLCIFAVCFFYSITDFVDEQKLTVEFLLITHFAIIGLLLLCVCNDLLTSYLAIELLSLSSYLLSAHKKSSSYSVDAGLKYFIIGSISSAFFLLGSSLIYASSGTPSFHELHHLFSPIDITQRILLNRPRPVKDFSLELHENTLNKIPPLELILQSIRLEQIYNCSACTLETYNCQLKDLQSIENKLALLEFNYVKDCFDCNHSYMEKFSALQKTKTKIVEVPQFLNNANNPGVKNNCDTCFKKFEKTVEVFDNQAVMDFMEYVHGCVTKECRNIGVWKKSVMEKDFFFKTLTNLKYKTNGLKNCSAFLDNLYSYSLNNVENLKQATYQDIQFINLVVKPLLEIQKSYVALDINLEKKYMKDLLDINTQITEKLQLAQKLSEQAEVELFEKIMYARKRHVADIIIAAICPDYVFDRFVFPLNNTNFELVELGIFFILISIFIKLALAPFHLWSLDVYEGSPTISTFFFSVMTKLSLFMFLSRFCYGAMPAFLSEWQFYSLWVSVISLFIGSIGGLRQRKLKTLMAYSSINHMGYALLAFSVGSCFSLKILLIYLIIYMISGMSFWFSFLLLRLKTNRKNKSSKELSDLALLAKSNPALAFSLAINFFSLAGLPPLIGFVTKIFVFLSLLKTNLYFFCIFAVLCSVISTFFYIRVIKVMFFENLLVGKLYYPIKSNKVWLLSFYTFLLVFLFVNPKLLFLLISFLVERQQYAIQ